MSFLLLFFKPIDQKILLNDVLDYFNNRPNFTTKSLGVDNHRFYYKNEHTEVEFTIEYNEKNELVTDLTYDENYQFCYTSFTLQYIKPSFFAIEAIPIVKEFCDRFGFVINDVQNLVEPKNALKQYDINELIDSYDLNNKIAIEEFDKQIPLLKTTKEQSFYVYSYLNNFEQLEAHYSVNIPTLSFMKDIDTKHLFTVIIWENAKEILFPKCDYILIIKKVKGFLGMKKPKMSIVPFEIIIDTFKNYIKPINDNLYILENTTEQVLDLFNSLPDTPAEKFEIISNNEFVE